MSKVIIVDMSVLSFKSIFNFELALKYKKGGDYTLPASYTYFSSLISCLKKIGVDSQTEVILALDDKSWRKNVCADYKATRQEAREKHTLINWEKEFASINRINEQLDYATPFHVLRIPMCESDDIASVASRVFKDKEIILATIDADWTMLAYYENVKIFSLNFKTSKGKGGYLNISKEDALKVLDKKVRLGDKGDNVLVYPQETIEDIEMRKTLVNLLELPEEIELKITEVLQNLPKKEGIKWEYLPFKDSLGRRLADIYDEKFRISYEYCLKLQAKRLTRKKKAKSLKVRAKRQIEKENKDVL